MGPVESVSAEPKANVLAKGMLWNVAGQVIPLLVAIVSIPALIHLLGLGRFGFLTLVWALIGYFGLLDLGLGRAVTKLVAQRLAEGRKQATGEILCTAIALMAALGFVGAIAVALSAEWLSSTGLGVPTDLQHEARITCYVLAVTIPFVTTGSALLGYLSALQRFDVINAVRIPVGLLNYLAPLAVAMVTTHLAVVVSVVVVTRLASWLLYGWFCVRELQLQSAPLRIRREQLKPLFSFGAWITVSNVLGPFMVYLDRFVLAGVASIAAVAYYTTPYEAITKLWIVPSALIMVLFPAFAYTHASKPGNVARMYVRSIKFIGIVLFPITLLSVAFAEDVLTLWLGSEFAQQSYRVLQILAVGVFVNSLAQVPSTLIQSVGRPDINAKLHLIELPIYVVLLVLLTEHFGIVGAAIAWLARSVVDALALSVFAGLQVVGTGLSARALSWTLVAVGTFGVVALVTAASIKASLVIAALLVFIYLGWSRLVNAADRQAIHGLLAARKVAA